MATYFHISTFRRGLSSRVIPRFFLCFFLLLSHLCRQQLNYYFFLIIYDITTLIFQLHALLAKPHATCAGRGKAAVAGPSFERRKHLVSFTAATGGDGCFFRRRRRRGACGAAAKSFFPPSAPRLRRGGQKFFSAFGGKNLRLTAENSIFHEGI